MDWENRGLRIGALVLAMALLIRLLGTEPIAARVQALEPEDILSVVLFLEAGRVVKKMPEQTLPATEPTVPAAATVLSDPQLPSSFSREDLAVLQINNLSGYTVDPEALLRQNLQWDLTQEGPAVLILHSHATESYQNHGNYEETARFRTTDTDYNMVSIGAELTRLLEEKGIGVIHDTRLHDAASYSDAYPASRQAVEDYLAQFPSIRLVLDLHRDAAQTASGEQVAYTSTLGGKSAAQLMIVSGSDAGGLSYPQWEQNLAVAAKLQVALERHSPGLCRPLSLRSQRYNQDLHPAALLIEVGAAGNDHSEAILAVQLLAEGILELSHGTLWTEGS